MRTQTRIMGGIAALVIFSVLGLLALYRHQIRQGKEQQMNGNSGGF